MDRYFVLSDDDVITHVSAPLQAEMGKFIGHSIWVRMPGAEILFRPSFQEARRTGVEVECVAFYAGGTLRLRVVPSGDSLTVYPKRLSELNVRSLATLRASLERMVSELDARAPAPRDPRARGSLRALP